MVGMSLRHAVLGLLSSGPASGYDLLKRFEISLANVWPATQSQLYSELNRMADAALVKVAAEGPRGRKEYAITDAGMAELRHWMTEVEPDRPRRSDMLLRVFFLDLIPPAEAIAYLHRQVEFAAKRYSGLTGSSRTSRARTVRSRSTAGSPWNGGCATWRRSATGPNGRKPRSGPPRPATRAPTTADRAEVDQRGRNARSFASVGVPHPAKESSCVLPTGWSRPPPPHCPQWP